MRFGARELGVAFGTIGLLVGACGGGISTEECLPGDFQALSIGDGGSALYRCGDEGGAYVPYDGPNPYTPPDSSVPDAAACGANGAPLTYFCAGCSATSPCVSGLDCTPFPNKGGNICTPPCTSATADICVPPSEGCGNNGHCKP